SAAGWRNHIVRDERHLRWRYEGSPRPYVIVCSDNGYAVVWPSKPMGSRTIAGPSHLGELQDDLGALRRARADGGGAGPAATGSGCGAIAVPVRPARAGPARCLRQGRVRPDAPDHAPDRPRPERPARSRPGGLAVHARRRRLLLTGTDATRLRHPAGRPGP